MLLARFGPTAVMPKPRRGDVNAQDSPYRFTPDPAATTPADERTEPT
jgi:hypothetical protein